MLYLILIMGALVLTSIVLVGGVIYLGPVLDRAGPETQARKTVASAREIASAAHHYRSAQGETPTSITTLLDHGYLPDRPGDPITDAAASPDDLAINPAGSAVTLDVSGNDALCEDVNGFADHASAPTAVNEKGTFGCVRSTGTFYMRL